MENVTAMQQCFLIFYCQSPLKEMSSALLIFQLESFVHVREKH